MTDNHEAAKNEALDNERRAAEKGWPFLLADGSEVMISGEKIVNGTRYLRSTVGLLVYDVAAQGWVVSDLQLDAEAVPADVPVDEEPPSAEPVPANDPAADDLNEIEAVTAPTQTLNLGGIADESEIHSPGR